MARRPLHRADSLFVVLLLAVEASGLLLTLANFQSISTISLPLRCVFAYKTPLRGCFVDDFGQGNTCSSICERGILAVEKKIQASCDLVSTGSTSLLDQAQRGKLVVVICGNNQPPPPERTSTSISFPPPRSFSKIPSNTPSPAASRATTKSNPASTTSATPSPTKASSRASTTTSTTVSTRTSTSDNGDLSTPTSTITPIATSSRTQGSSTEALVSTTRTATTSSTDQPAPRRTQPPGGGGSPFDFVPGTASQTSVDLTSKIIAVLSFAVAIYMH